VKIRTPLTITLHAHFYHVCVFCSFMYSLFNDVFIESGYIKLNGKKVKQSRYRPGVAQRVSES